MKKICKWARCSSQDYEQTRLSLKKEKKKETNVWICGQNEVLQETLISGWSIVEPKRPDFENFFGVSVQKYHTT